MRPRDADPYALPAACAAALGALADQATGSERPAREVSEHLRSCLGCFRAAADLRELPRLVALLDEDARGPGSIPGAGFGPDPGDAFWSAFPAKVGAAWAAREQASGRAPALAETVPELAPGRRSVRPGAPGGLADLPARLAAWLRRPVPAALLGAVCATAVAMLVLEPAGIEAPAPASGGLASDPGAVPASPGRMLVGQEDVAFGQSASVYESVGDLDGPALLSMRAALERELSGRELAARAELEIETVPLVGIGMELPGEAGADLAGEAAREEELGSSATGLVAAARSVGEELDQLDEHGLAALRSQLRREGDR